MNVIEALRKSTAAPQLCALIKEVKEVAIRRDLARLLHKSHDPRAADTLASILDSPDEDTRMEAAQGLAELGDKRAVEPLLQLARSTDIDTGNDAVDSLRLLGDPAAGPGLLTLLAEVPQRKAAILRALGANHYLEAGPAIEKEIDGDDIGAATKALGELPYPPAYAKLVKMMIKPPGIDFSTPKVENEIPYRNRFEAMQGIRYFGKPEPSAVRELIKIVEDPTDDFRLVTAAGEVLGRIADDKLLNVILAKVKDKKLPEQIRIAYMQGFWLSSNREFAKQLLPLFESGIPTEIQRAAGLAVGYAGDPSNDPKLIAMLDSPETRRSAAIAIVLGGSEEAAKKLLQTLLKDRDLSEWIREAILTNENDHFNILSQAMFDSGQIFRRMRVAEILKDGSTQNASYTYVWGHLLSRLALGWPGPGGISARDVLRNLSKALNGEKPDLRRISAEALATIGEYGLLLAARDAGVKEARDALKKLEKPTTTTAAEST